MTQDCKMIRDAWLSLADLVGMMTSGHRFEEDPPYTLDQVEGRCRRFLEEYDEYKQRQK